MARCQESHSDNRTEEASVSIRDSTRDGLDYVSMKHIISTKISNQRQRSQPIDRHNHTPRDHQTGGDERSLYTAATAVLGVG